ncbi:MAG: adenylyltransferase/cytidyltransferase family protein [Proteobacteria bacterium]|nr:adenylyltransferase/cytidyltransferase family protein [Pseudomonadota bacterium]
MWIARHPDCPPQTAGGSVVTIGNFDGVHRGHQAVLTTARMQADVLGVPLVALTFEPHPRAVLRPEQAPVRLTEFATKATLLGKFGADGVYVIDFSKDYAKTSPQDFIADTLVGALRAKCVVVGHDFCFGRDRSAGLALLREMAPDSGYTVEEVTPFVTDGGVCSSSRIRALLQEGQTDAAERLLGHAIIDFRP